MIFDPEDVDIDLKQLEIGESDEEEDDKDAKKGEDGENEGGDGSETCQKKPRHH